MSEEVRNRLRAGEALPVGSMKIPMVDLPLGATEDRVCGTIDIEKALTEGEALGGESGMGRRARSALKAPRHAPACSMSPGIPPRRTHGTAIGMRRRRRECGCSCPMCARACPA